MEPRYLGKQNNTPSRDLDLIPWTGGKTRVRLECSEFTSFCPVTGQPDFGTLVIEYEPDAHLIETKSVKLFLWSWRETGQFNEVIVDEIATLIFAALRPRALRVHGDFNTRGGISVHVQAFRGARMEASDGQAQEG